MFENIQLEKPDNGLEDYAAEFHQDRTDELSQLNSYVTNSDFENIRALAHRWKGFCDPYGFKILSQLSIQLEQEAIAGDLNSVLETVNKINKYLELKSNYL